jgi:hypothetical protein
VEAANEVAGQLLAIELIEIACSEVAKVLVTLDHVVGSREDKSGDGHEGALRTLAALDALELPWSYPDSVDR